MFRHFNPGIELRAFLLPLFNAFVDDTRQILQHETDIPVRILCRERGDIMTPTTTNVNEAAGI